MTFVFKTGTRVDLLTADILRGLILLAGIMETVCDAKVLTITSVNEGVHKVGSLHFTGNAIDIRSKVFPLVLVQAAMRVFRATVDGPKYDLIHEFPGLENEHLHLEYDPSHTNTSG